MAVGKSSILKLYKTMLREAQNFPAYNFRMYALRRIRDGFRENKCLQEPGKIEEQLSYARESLEMIKRQVILGQIYGTDKLIIERKR